MNTINNVNYQLIGLCCIENKQDDPVYQTLRKQWDDRFHDRNSFWLDVKNLETRAIAQELRSKIDATGLPPAYNLQYQVAVFHDLRDSLDTKSVEHIEDFINKFGSHFPSHTIAMTMHYVYVGNFSEVDEGYESRKIDVGALQKAIRGNTRISLVAEQEPGRLNGECWQPVIAVTDVFRRIEGVNPLNGIDPQYRIGFFTHRRYDAKLRKENEGIVHQHLVLLDENVDQSQFEMIQAEFEHKLNALAAQVEQKYQPNGVFQPQHPDLILPTGLFSVFARNQALRPGGSYDRARRETECAVEATADKMVNGIKEEFGLSSNKADIVFGDMIANCSLYALRDGVIRTMLTNIHYQEPEPVMPLSLKYSPEGCEDRIDKYLKSKLKMTIYEGKVAYCEAIIAACDRHRVNNDYDKMIQEAISKKNDAQAKLERLPDLSEFCSNIIGQGNNMLSDIIPPNNSGTNVGFCICEGADNSQITAVVNTENNLRASGNRTDYFYQLPGAKDVPVPIQMIRLNLFDYFYSDSTVSEEESC